MKIVKISFPDRGDEQFGIIGCRELPDDATQFDALLALTEWAEKTYEGTDNRNHFSRDDAIAIHLVEG